MGKLRKVEEVWKKNSILMMSCKASWICIEKMIY